MFHFIDQLFLRNMLKYVAKRRFALSTAVLARGRIEKTPVYVDNPFLPAKKTYSNRITPANREQLNQWSAEVDKIELKMAKLQAVEVAQLLNKEIRRSAGLANVDRAKISTEKELKLAAEKSRSLYFWSLEKHFFALLESKSSITENCHQYQLTGGNQSFANKYSYSSSIVKARFNYKDQSTPFFGNYFDNVFIRVTSFWISDKCGSLFVHFCPTFRISLVLQITREASSICQVSSGDQDCVQNQNLPSFISKQDVYLIKVPLTKSTYLRLYAHVRKDDIEQDQHSIWQSNAVTHSILTYISH